MFSNCYCCSRTWIQRQLGIQWNNAFSPRAYFETFTCFCRVIVVGEAPVIEYNDRLDTKIRMSRTSVPTLYLCGGRQTIGGDRTSRPSARRGKRDHERSWAKRVFISSLHTSRSKVHEEGHPSCQARTGKNSCVHTALLQTARLHTNALRQ